MFCLSLLHIVCKTIHDISRLVLNFKSTYLCEYQDSAKIVAVVLGVIFQWKISEIWENYNDLVVGSC